jgi:type IV pilus assembly protein PilA
MLKAKLDSVRKNKKGFSLVELIIVIAIMVALIAVMAPAFVKYVQKSRDAALATAAEDLEKTVQTFFGDPDCEYQIPSSASITVKVQDKKLNIATTGLTETKNSKTLEAAILDAAGADTSKAMGTTGDVYTINIVKDGGNAKVTMTVVKAS